MQAGFEVVAEMRVVANNVTYTEIKAYLDVCDWRADIWVDGELRADRVKWLPRLGRFNKALKLGETALDVIASVELQEALEGRLRLVIDAMLSAGDAAASLPTNAPYRKVFTLEFGDNDRRRSVRLVDDAAE